jgi:hypothetical protein
MVHPPPELFWLLRITFDGQTEAGLTSSWYASPRFKPAPKAGEYCESVKLLVEVFVKRGSDSTE